MPENLESQSSRSGARSTSRRHWRVLLFLVVAAVVAAACGRKSGRAEIRMRPGGSLLDVVAAAVVEEYPRTNLSPDMEQEVQEPFLLIRDIDEESWRFAGDVPTRLRDAVPEHSQVRHWRAQPWLASARGLDLPVVLLDGEPADDWNPEQEAFPGLYVWYETDSGTLHALSEMKPTAVAIQYQVDPVDELGRYEKLLPAAGGRMDRRHPKGSAVQPWMIQREQIGDTSRPVLVLPAPGSVVFPLGLLRAEELEVAVGVVDRSYQRQGPAFRRARGLSDGVRFSVEMIADGHSEELWAFEMPKQEVGQGFHQVRVDLSAYGGQNVALRLRSDPGSAEDPFFDYAVWAGLRLLGPPEKSPDRPHIIIIDIDTLRPDRLGVYSYSRPTSPRIDSWADSNAVLFRDALAPGSWTPPSTTSMLTGLAPHQHLVLGHTNRLSGKIPTLATLLRNTGYETYSFSEAPFLREEFGLDQGFDINLLRIPSFDWALKYELRAGIVGEWGPWASQIFESRGSDRPVFMFFHTYLIHAPYAADLRFADPTYQGPLAGKSVGYPDLIHPVERGELSLDDADKAYVNALYDAGIARMDSEVGKFLESLENALGDSEALIFFTADHGEEFWERGGLNHGQSLHQELIRVPLIVQFPREDGKRRVGVSEGPASLLDIVPTALDFAGIDPPFELPGYSLREELPSDRARVAQTWSDQVSVQYGSRKLILAPHSGSPIQFYMLDQDPGELRNLAPDRPELVQEARIQLRRYLDTYPPLPIDELDLEHSREATAALRALGYLD